MVRRSSTSLAQRVAARVAVLLAGLLPLTAGCSSPSTETTENFYRDVKPIFDAHCNECHTENGFAPFAFGNYEDARAAAGLIREKVVAKEMPPWMPDDSCREYANRRSLTDAQIETIARWADQGAEEGIAPDFEPEPTHAPALSRIDIRLTMGEPFKQTISPDQQRCFVLDWPQDVPGFITGFGAEPGSFRTVHHISAFVIAPQNAELVRARDEADEGPGYDCFSGPGRPQYEIGSWSPGVRGYEYPAGAGYAIAPKSKIVIQVHYNSDTYPATSDQSTVYFRFAEKAERTLEFEHFLDPSWRRDLKIPAYSDDTVVRATFDPPPKMPRTIYMTNTHQHWLGAHSKLTIVHADGSRECLLDIPRWNFHWQTAYILSEPAQIEEGAKLELECQWDNTEKNQRMVGGRYALPTDTRWGTQAAQEMCIGGLFTAEP